MVTRLITFGTSNTPSNGNSVLPTDNNLTLLPIGGTVFDNSDNLIVFTTSSSNLIANDTNAQPDVYLYNQTSGTFSDLTLRKFNGALTNQPSRNPSINGSGTRVVLESEDNQLSIQLPLVFGNNIYLGENLNNSPPTFTLLTTNYNGLSYNPSISNTGNRVVFETKATTPTGGGDTNDRDIILFDLASSTSTWVSQITGGGGNPATAADSTNAAISGDGRYVVFQSDVPENQLIPAVTGNNGASDIFLFDRTDNSLRLVSRIPQAAPIVAGNNSSTNSAISTDGRYVAYQSFASNLVTGDTNGVSDIFLYEIATGQNTRINLRPGNIQTNSSSSLPAINSNGNSVAFASNDAFLVPNDTNSLGDIFVWKQATGQISRVSIDSAGLQANQASTNPAINSDGQKVAFQSSATNLGQPVQAGITNIFVNEQGGGPQRLESDFNNSGFNDILFVGPGPGLQAWNIFQDSNTKGFDVFNPNLNTPGLKASCVANLDGNNSPDIVYQAPSGTIFVRFNVSQGASASWGILPDATNPSATLSTPGLEPRAAYDANGDGRDEILFYKVADGGPFAKGTNFLYNPNLPGGTPSFNLLTGPGGGAIVTPDLQPFGAGLITGDNKPDIIYNIPSNGETKIYNTVTGIFEPLSPSDPNLTIPGFNVAGAINLGSTQPDQIVLQAQPGSTGPLQPGAVTTFNHVTGSFGQVLATTQGFAALV